MERKFECKEPGCGKTYIRKSDLTQHMKSHKPYDERPFVCSFASCGKRFTLKKQLKDHMISHLEFEKISENPLQFNMHVKTPNDAEKGLEKSKDKRFECKESGCGRSYGRK